MSAQNLGATNAQLSARIQDLYAKLNALTTRVTALEQKPSGTDYSAQIAALGTRLTVLEAKVCPQESRIASLEADHVPE